MSDKPLNDKEILEKAREAALPWGKCSGWNYRVVHKRIGEEDQYGVHEVYYDADDKPFSCTVNPVSGAGDTYEEAEKGVALMLLAFKEPVLEYSDF